MKLFSAIESFRFFFTFRCHNQQKARAYYYVSPRSERELISYPGIPRGVVSAAAHTREMRKNIYSPSGGKEH